MGLSNIRLRILSIVCILSPLLLLTLYSDIFAFLIIITMSCLIVYELILNQNKNKKIIYGLIAGIISMLPFIINSYYDSVSNIQNNTFYIISILIILLFFILHIPKKTHLTSTFINNLASILFGSIVSIYIALILIINKKIFLLILMIISISDSSSFAIGKMFGKNQLAKSISPGKTIEGAIGGIILTIIIGSFVSSILVKNTILTSITYNLMLVLSAQIGDLLFSKIKRNRNIKDFGKLFPGHGGLIDRIDSSLITFMFGYFIFFEWIKV
jgi:phosphatidate cytidylyltransferase